MDAEEKTAAGEIAMDAAQVIFLMAGRKGALLNEFSLGEIVQRAIDKSAAKARTCDTCRHWEKRHPSFGPECVSPEFHQSVRSDADHLHAHFETSPKFGCVHWEAKTETT